MIRPLLSLLCFISILFAFTLRYHLAQVTHPPVSVTDSMAKGGFHIHTYASHDGRQSLEEVIEAARDLKFDFIIITDHNIQKWDIYESHGIWVIKGPEQSTPNGHLIQLFADKGTTDIVAHPGKRNDTDISLLEQAQGIELANPTVTLEKLITQSPSELFIALISYLAEPSVSLLSILDVDARALKFLQGGKAPSLWCGVDAHGWLPAKWNLAIWAITLPIQRTNLSVDTIKDALKKGPLGCFSPLIATNNPMKVNVEKSGSWEFSLSKNLDHRGSFRLYRNGYLISTSAKKDFTYMPKIPGHYHLEYWFHPRGVSFLDKPRLGAMLDLKHYEPKTKAQ